MKKIEIRLTDDQYDKLINSIQKFQITNSQEETFSGFELILAHTELGVSLLELKTNSVLSIGEVEWDFNEL